VDSLDKRPVNAVMNLRVPQNAGKVSGGFTTGGLSVMLGSIELVSYSCNRPWRPPQKAVRL
jgi:hypothetical protein